MTTTTKFIVIAIAIVFIITIIQGIRSAMYTKPIVKTLKNGDCINVPNRYFPFSGRMCK